MAGRRERCEEFRQTWTGSDLGPRQERGRGKSRVDLKFLTREIKWVDVSSTERIGEKQV